MEVVGWLDVEHLSIEGGGDQLIQRRTHRIITLPSTMHQFARHTAKCTLHCSHSSLCQFTLCTELNTVLLLHYWISKFTHTMYTSSSLQVESTCQLQLTNCFTVLLIDITQRISKCSNDPSTMQAVAILIVSQWLPLYCSLTQVLRRLQNTEYRLQYRQDQHSGN